MNGVMGMVIPCMEFAFLSLVLICTFVQSGACIAWLPDSIRHG